MQVNKIICGKCEEVLKDFPNNSIDTIITDPPYGLSFMGKKWDYSVPSIEIWQECLRVLKPGGIALIFAGSRTQHRMAVNVEDAGFILKDCIMWLYGSGFPKASDISQMLDKDKCRKQLEKKLGRKPTKKEYKKAWDNFRKIVGYKETSSYPDSDGVAYYKNRSISKGSQVNTGGMPEITAPATPEATLWNGWKSHGLKPAYEPILVATKPNEGSYANNALKWGVAGLNIDGGRIEMTKKDFELYKEKRESFNGTIGNNIYGGNSLLISKTKHKNNIETKGRYPANLILDEEAGRLLDEQSGIKCGAFAPVKKAKRPNNVYGEYATFGDNGKTFRGDTGGASRFFYCAKASKSERNRGCEGLESKYNDDSRKDKNAMGCNNPNNRSGTPKQNHHPTVKPLSLMKYLCTITKTPTGGIVLDPFAGSGTTLMACKETGRDYIGIEKDKEYVEIARRRISAIPASLF